MWYSYGALLRYCIEIVNPAQKTTSSTSASQSFRLTTKMSHVLAQFLETQQKTTKGHSHPQGGGGDDYSKASNNDPRNVAPILPGPCIRLRPDPLEYLEPSVHGAAIRHNARLRRHSVILKGVINRPTKIVRAHSKAVDGLEFIDLWLCSWRRLCTRCSADRTTRNGRQCRPTQCIRIIRAPHPTESGPR